MRTPYKGIRNLPHLQLLAPYNPPYHLGTSLVRHVIVGLGNDELLQVGSLGTDERTDVFLFTQSQLSQPPHTQKGLSSSPTSSWTTSSSTSLAPPRSRRTRWSILSFWMLWDPPVCDHPPVASQQR